MIRNHLLALCLLTGILAAPAHARLVYEFNSSTQGWTALNHVTGVTATTTSLTFTYTGTDPHLGSPAALNLATASHRYFILDITFGASHGGPDTFQLFFNVGSGYSEAHSIAFAVQQGRRSYVFDMSTNANWTGTMSQFRIDPGSGPAGSSQINWMGFVNGPREWEFASSVEGWVHAQHTAPGTQTSINHDGAGSLQVNYGLAANSPGDVTVNMPDNSVVPGLHDWMRVEYTLTDADANISLPTDLTTHVFPATGGYQYMQHGNRYPNLGKQVIIYNHYRTNNGPGTTWGVDSFSNMRFDTPDGAGTNTAWSNAVWLFDYVRFTSSPGDSAPYNWTFASDFDNWTLFPFSGFVGTSQILSGKAVITGIGNNNVLFGNWGLAMDTVAARKLTIDLALNRASGSADVPLRIFFDNDGLGYASGTESISTTIPSALVDGVTRSFTFDLPTHVNAGSRTWGANNYFRYATMLAAQLNANGNNMSIIAYENISVTADSDTPSLSSVQRNSPATATTSAGSATFLVTFSERVNNINAADFTPVIGGGLSGGTIGTVTPLMTLNGYAERALVTVNGLSGTGTVGLGIAPGTDMRDALNNAFNTGAAPGTNESYNIDQDPPAVGIGAPSDPIINSSGDTDFLVTYTGATSISLVPGNVSINHSGTSGGSVSVSGTGTGARTVTVAGVTGDGSFTISIAAGTATDGAGNTALAAGPSASVTVDSTQPGISIGAPIPAAVSSTSTVDFLITYTGASSITLVPGQVTVNYSPGTSGGNVTVSGSGSTERTVSIAGINGDGSITINISASTAQDLAGNLAPAAGPSASVVVDNTPPTPILSSSAPNPVNAPYVVNIDTSEPVTTFDMADLTLTNATPSGFSGSGQNYSVTINPSADGNTSVRLNSGAFTDPASNASLLSATLSRVYDGTPPSVTSRVPAVGATVSQLTTVNILFDDIVTGVVAANLEINGSPATSVTGSGAGPYVFSGFTQPGNGAVGAILLPGNIRDTANNLFLGSSWVYTANNALPTVVLTSPTVTDGGFTNQVPTFNAVFSEAVTGFTATDVTVTNATFPITGLSGSGANYSFTVTPVANGAVTVRVPANRANAVAPPNNANAASTTFSFTYDTTPPVIVLNDDENVSLDCADGYFDPGVLSATDNIDGDLLNFVTVSGDTVTPTTPPRPAPYVTTYTVTDQAGNVAVKNRFITVTDNCNLVLERDTPATIFPAEFITVSIRVNAIGAFGATTFDWQKEITPGNWVSIGAPSSRTLTFVNIQLSDTGRYRCVVTDQLETEISPVFTVLVGVGLPAAGILGIAAATGLSALAGAWALRRRK